MTATAPTLAELLPHAPPMILLSGYTPDDSVDTASAFVDITKSSPFFDCELDGVPACVALEYMAQTMAVLVGLTRRRQGLPPQIGFVLGSRKLEIKLPCFQNHHRYRVFATCSYTDEEFGAFDCRIEDETAAIVACGTLTAYQASADDKLP